MASTSTSTSPQGHPSSQAPKEDDGDVDPTTTVSSSPNHNNHNDNASPGIIKTEADLFPCPNTLDLKMPKPSYSYSTEDEDQNATYNSTSTLPIISSSSGGKSTPAFTTTDEDLDEEFGKSSPMKDNPFPRYNNCNKRSGRRKSDPACLKKLPKMDLIGPILPPEDDSEDDDEDFFDLSTVRMTGFEEEDEDSFGLRGEEEEGYVGPLFEDYELEEEEEEEDDDDDDDPDFNPNKSNTKKKLRLSRSSNRHNHSRGGGRGTLRNHHQGLRYSNSMDNLNLCSKYPSIFPMSLPQIQIQAQADHHLSGVKGTQEEEEEKVKVTVVGDCEIRDEKDMFHLSWKSHQFHLLEAFDSLLQNQTFCDVTLICDEENENEDQEEKVKEEKEEGNGRKVTIKAHKMVLSSCSNYFRQILQDSPCKHTVIVFKEFAAWEIQATINFMYKGQVEVKGEQLEDLRKTASALQIQGLLDSLEKSSQQQLITGESPSPPTLGRMEVGRIDHHHNNNNNSPEDISDLKNGGDGKPQPERMEALNLSVGSEGGSDKYHRISLPRRKQARPRRTGFTTPDFIPLGRSDDDEDEDEGGENHEDDILMDDFDEHEPMMMEDQDEGVEGPKFLLSNNFKKLLPSHPLKLNNHIHKAPSPTILSSIMNNNNKEMTMSDHESPNKMRRKSNDDDNADEMEVIKTRRNNGNEVALEDSEMIPIPHRRKSSSRRNSSMLVEAEFPFGLIKDRSSDHYHHHHHHHDRHHHPGKQLEEVIDYTMNNNSGSGNEGGKMKEKDQGKGGMMIKDDLLGISPGGPGGGDNETLHHQHLAFLRNYNWAMAAQAHQHQQQQQQQQQQRGKSTRGDAGPFGLPPLFQGEGLSPPHHQHQPRGGGGMQPKRLRSPRHALPPPHPQHHHHHFPRLPFPPSPDMPFPFMTHPNNNNRTANGNNNNNGSNNQSPDNNNKLSPPSPHHKHHSSPGPPNFFLGSPSMSITPLVGDNREKGSTPNTSNSSSSNTPSSNSTNKTPSPRMSLYSPLSGLSLVSNRERPGPKTRGSNSSNNPPPPPWPGLPLGPPPIFGRHRAQHSAPRGGPPRAWSNADLTEALHNVWNKKMTTSQASRIFGIPYNSLLMYVRGKYGKSLKLDLLKKGLDQALENSNLKKAAAAKAAASAAAAPPAAPPPPPPPDAVKEENATNSSSTLAGSNNANSRNSPKTSNPSPHPHVHHPHGRNNSPSDAVSALLHSLHNNNNNNNPLLKAQTPPTNSSSSERNNNQNEGPTKPKQNGRLRNIPMGPGSGDNRRDFLTTPPDHLPPGFNMNPFLFGDFGGNNPFPFASALQHILPPHAALAAMGGGHHHHHHPHPSLLAAAAAAAAAGGNPSAFGLPPPGMTSPLLGLKGEKVGVGDEEK